MVTWEGTEEIKPLIETLNQLFAHGLYLLTKDIEKAHVAINLATDLKKDLRDFMDLSPKERKQKKSQFKQQFINKLHSKDDVMTTHRAYWKVIIANILIALTGIGLIALGVQYATNGHCFYAKTKRENLVDSIEKTTELCLVKKNPGNAPIQY